MQTPIYENAFLGVYRSGELGAWQAALQSLGPLGMIQTTS